MTEGRRVDPNPVFNLSCLVINENVFGIIKVIYSCHS